jgi:hypothetical protein
MSQDNATRIRVGNSPVGIIGLKTFMEDMAEEYKDRPDREVIEELLSRLEKRNYIPEIAKEEYGKAFLREFKKFIGEPFNKEVSEVPEIKVLGPGCFQCNSLEKELMGVMAEIDLVADVEHVTDLKEIGKYGVMGTPALIINGEVKAVGSVPPRSKLKEWLTEVQV